MRRGGLVRIGVLCALQRALGAEVYVSDGARGFYSSASVPALSEAPLHARNHSGSSRPSPSPAIPPDPVGDYDFPDPSVTQHEGTYYAFGGNMVMSSTDLASWS